ncbi:AraC family transcriptional regulator [Paenibacillus sp. 1011MAR3C5]|uniref:AraC family transcriptional regulator n=1 Tax=Paenibacillus sp. 1011MAR3C5 TaxID=1675787 RepID=UPI000E6BA0B9|nr:AraC family transcriptional regulator [Paenibacillus sp. 1011MAR3C5]RJE87649.1 AraC family transcriptional regulator [Paenibacillus sp. 1011MAR3C5]
MKPETYRVASNPTIEKASESAALRVLFSGESQTASGHILGPKVYDFYLMHLVLSGRGIFELNGKSYELEAGHTFLIKPGQLIRYESDEADPWRYRWIAFKGTEAAALAEIAGFDTGETQHNRLSDLRRASTLYRSVYHALSGEGAAADLEAAGYLQLLMAAYRKAAIASSRHTEEADSHGDQLHQRVVRFLSAQYTHAVSIEAMADSLGYNRAYLSRVFKRKTGLSPVSFLLRLRLDRAKLMLRERPELTVGQVAASVGMQDALYFSKQFKKQHDMSPIAYRQDILGQQRDS